MRLQRIQKVLQEAGVGLALAPGEDFRYAVGWSPHADERLTWLFITPEAVHLVVPAVNAEEARTHLGDGVPLSRYSDDAGPRLALREALDAVGRQWSWLVSDDARYDHARTLEELAQRPLGFASSILGELRMQKDAEELALLRESQRINDEAMQQAFEAMRPEMTEVELADVIRRAFIAAGADRDAFIIVAAGEHSALPHHTPTQRALGRGPVLLDIGCYYRGYASDMTRVAYLGEPPAKFREIHALVNRASEAAQKVAAPGVPAAVVDRAARAVIEAGGYGDYFVHRLGHGIGLSVHEPPSVMAGNSRLLPPDCTFSIEPGIYLPGEFGVRLEEVVINRPGGVEVLSRVPRDIYVKAV
ncbi:MAG: Xaa-Pro peptidase family protein [Firmicutes bacterium]|nr:Xaa-Pro peptidase family protein [Bacillota bacterium]